MSITKLKTYTVVDPGCCGVEFAMDDTVLETRKRDHKDWWCPNCGSRRYYPATTKTPDQKRIEELERENACIRRSKIAAEETARRRKRQLAYAKGQRTKLLNQIRRGECPCCGATFKNVRRHMARMHPEMEAPDEA